MTKKQELAQQEKIFKVQKEAAELDLRNRCLQMSLDYHRSSGQKRGYAIDMEAVEPIQSVKRKPSKGDALKIFAQTGVIAVNTRNAEGKLITAVRQLEYPRPVSEAEILKTANQFYEYISKNKVK